MNSIESERAQTQGFSSGRFRSEEANNETRREHGDAINQTRDIRGTQDVDTQPRDISEPQTETLRLRPAQ